MKKVKFIVEKTNTGYSAFTEDNAGIAATTGDTIAELKSNATEAYNALMEYTHKMAIVPDQIELAFNLD